MAESTFAALVTTHRREILGYLTRLLGNPADAEDACQDAFLRAYRAFARLPDRSNHRAWLFTIATRTALNHRRQRTRRVARTADADPDLLPGPETPAHAVAPNRVRAAVQALPAKQRAALMQRVFHDLSYDQIARTLGGSPAAARANVYQALKRLRLVLVPRQPGEEKR